MTPISFKRHRFSPEIIQHAVWLYARFTLSFRDVEDLLAERGLDVSYETVRRWVLATSTGHSAADFRYWGRSGHPNAAAGLLLLMRWTAPFLVVVATTLWHTVMSVVGAVHRINNGNPRTEHRLSGYERM